MKCKAARKLIPSYVDGELGVDKEVALREHLASCSCCRQETAGLKSAVQALGAFAGIEPSFTLADIRERAAQRQSAIPAVAWLRRVPRLATAAMLLAAIAAGSLSGAYYSLRTGSKAGSRPAVSERRVSDSFGLDAFDDGLAGAMYVADAGNGPAKR